MSRLFACKPLVAALSAVFCGAAAAETAWQPQSAFACTPPARGAARYAPAQTSGGGRLPENAVRITADRVDGQTGVRAAAQGSVIIERNGETLNADKAVYEQSNNSVRTEGGFVLTDRHGDTVRGRDLHYRLDEGAGEAADAEFAAERGGRRLQGAGGRMVMKDKNRAVLRDVVFNTCKAGDRSWYVQAASLDADRNTNIGVVRHARLVFGGVPVLYTPWADFPLSGNRKSGFLVPALKVGSNGTELELPYYFNLAPNYDLTVSPGVMSSRGATFGGEARYLTERVSGSLKTKYMPHDRKNSKQKHRYETRWRHDFKINDRLSGGAELHQVSDDDYYRDFHGRDDAAENVQLPRRAWLSYRNTVNGAPFEADVLVQKYQTLADADGRKQRPYALLPRLSAHWYKNNGRLQWQAAAQFSRFSHPEKQNGNRLLLYPSVSWHLDKGWAYLRPKLGLHLTRYWLKEDGGRDSRHASRVLPVANAEAGAAFERPVKLFGGRFVQTLEPKWFYNYIPRKSQNDLPNFDASENSFSYEQLFRENRYSGGDRINAANSLSFGLQTRLLDAFTGAERFRAGIGGKRYFNADDVALDGSVFRLTRRKSDIAAFAGGQIGGNWFADTQVHYDRDRKNIRRADAGVSYRPEAGKALSFRYKYGRDEEIAGGEYGVLRHADFGFQWPLNPRLYAVGRLNYSIRPRSVLEQMLGLEYRSACGCWGATVAAQRYVAAPGRYKHAVFLTLQLKDLSSIGSNPAQMLRLGVPGYRKTNEVMTK